MYPLLTTTVVLLLALLPAGTRSQDNILEDSDGQPIFCFQCNSGLDPDCPNLQANNTASPHYKPCIEYGEYKGAKPFCRKIVQNIFEREMVRVIRKCGWERHTKGDCYFNSNDDHTEVVCQCFSDGCNGAVRTSLAAATLVSVLAVIYTLAS
ncbi:uncharacterized protein LOC128990276 [Macrosteles quadrilineatus]|uniref:uncharacterized protein LOC128990276 n=1 Tax=Macrosteles quadrilineatus TaxID=74068 RepID=UPI0023E28BF4|nr:uncharacterized protein LOC128990276 [Macrosteles quadrilineatus]